ncbi:MAG: hypothetical protein ABGW69_00420 [Nanoarchaeota archaeon]
MDLFSQNNDLKTLESLINKYKKETIESKLNINIGQVELKEYSFLDLGLFKYDPINDKIYIHSGLAAKIMSKFEINDILNSFLNKGGENRAKKKEELYYPSFVEALLSEDEIYIDKERRVKITTPIIDLNKALIEKYIVNKLEEESNYSRGDIHEFINIDPKYPAKIELTSLILAYLSFSEEISSKGLMNLLKNYNEQKSNKVNEANKENYKNFLYQLKEMVENEIKKVEDSQDNTYIFPIEGFIKRIKNITTPLRRLERLHENERSALLEEHKNFVKNYGVSLEGLKKYLNDLIQDIKSDMYKYKR